MPTVRPSANSLPNSMSPTPASSTTSTTAASADSRRGCSEEHPRGAWDFLFQIDSVGPLGNDVNFGDAGVGYGFLSPDEEEGRFLWQCC